MGTAANRIRQRVFLLAGISVAATSSFPAGAHAQTGPDSVKKESPAPAASDGQVAVPDGSDPGGQVDDIIVTAQRRTENLQSVPISALVVSGKALTAANVNSLTDMSLRVPSIRVDGGTRANNLSIRGIGSGGNPSFDQSVSIFIDDVYHGRSRISNSSFLDLDRVEVLKGPQSTFFGNNAIAGAVDVVTAKPGHDLSGWARMLYGTYGQYAVEGATNLPLSSTLSARVAATANGQRGWIKDITSDKHNPSTDNLAGRVKLLWEPSANFDATLKVDASRGKNSGPGSQIANCPPPAPYVASRFCTAALAGGLPIGFNTGKNSILPGQYSRLVTNDDTLTMNFRSGGHTFTSVTAFFGYNYEGTQDIAGLPSRQFTLYVPERYRQFSQEFRVTSPTGGAIEYVAGAYYQKDRLRYDTGSNYFYLTPTISAVPALAALTPYLPLGGNIRASQDGSIKSVFASVTWNATDAIKITGSIRGSWAHKDFSWNQYYGTATENYGGIVPLPANIANLPALLGIGTPGVLSASRSDHAWMPSARIQYKINSEAMVYASYARGFKEGGFNGTDNMATGLNAAQLAFEPEHVDAYEVGLKSEWFDRRLRINVAAFLSNYSNLQVSQSKQTASGAFANTVGNGAFARSQGIEFEGQWALTRNFRITANVSYIDSYFTSFEGVPLNGLQTFCSAAANRANPTCIATFGGQYLLRTQSLTGQPTPLSPKWAGSVALNYQTTLTNGFGLAAEITDIFASRSFQNTGLNDPYLLPPSQQRIDARLSLTFPGKRFTIDLIGKNLNNGKTYSLYSNLPSTPGSIIFIQNPPRSVAVQLGFNW